MELTLVFILTREIWKTSKINHSRWRYRGTVPQTNPTTHSSSQAPIWILEVDCLTKITSFYLNAFLCSIILYFYRTQRTMMITFTIFFYLHDSFSASLRNPPFLTFLYKTHLKVLIKFILLKVIQSNRKFLNSFKHNAIVIREYHGYDTMMMEPFVVNVCLHLVLS